MKSPIPTRRFLNSQLRLIAGGSRGYRHLLVASPFWSNFPFFMVLILTWCCWCLSLHQVQSSQISGFRATPFFEIILPYYITIFRLTIIGIIGIITIFRIHTIFIDLSSDFAAKRASEHALKPSPRMGSCYLPRGHKKTHTHTHVFSGKSPFFMGQSTISMAIFNSFLYVYQRVCHVCFSMFLFLLPKLSSMFGQWNTDSDG